jgi:glycosyltransferase involved in cell wall biosynthesis
MRTYNLLKHLAADYDFTLVCLGRPEETNYDTTPIADYARLVVVEREASPGTLQAARLSLSSSRPVTTRLYGSEALRTTIRDLLRERRVDVAHVESFYMLQNLPAERAFPVLLSEPAIEYRAWGQYARVAKPWYTRPGVFIEALKMRQVEPSVWAEADMVGAMSEVDAAIIRKAAPRTEVVLAPNGVDVSYFEIDPGVNRERSTAVYMGDYKYFPNVDAVTYFVNHIMPRIKRQRPDFRLILLGKDPTPEIQRLGQRDDITVTGMVDDTRPYLHRSGVFICPLRSGSGTRFKLLEALACGCPVVSTSIGCEGLNAIDGQHMLIRDRPRDFAEAVLELLDHPAHGEAMGVNGRAWVVENHAWERSAALVSDAYQRLMTMRAEA